MRTLLLGLLGGVGLVVGGGTLLSFSRHPHWGVRVWDFPRLQLAVLGTVAGVVYATWFCTWAWYEWLFVLALAGCVGWQGAKIVPYTPLAPVQVPQARGRADAASLCLLVANVCMQNRQYARFLQLVQAVDPDLILAVEIDDAWLVALQPLARPYPYAVRQPQTNMYGMGLWSRLPLIAPRVRFLIQTDIPSIHTEVELRNGTRLFLVGVHPRPPEPLRDQDATARDAELVRVGRELRTHQRPTVVAGDLNDVAWSDTTALFLRLSGLLDPRVGRGMYNTFPAHIPVFRYPLDHIFHSPCFTLMALQRLAHIGSDHFPICVTLRYDPAAAAAQPPLAAAPAQEAEAQAKLDGATTDPSIRAGEGAPPSSDTCCRGPSAGQAPI